MSSSHQARYGALTALTVFAAAVLCLLSLGSANASAADVTTGTAQFTIGAGKGGKVLISNGVKVKQVAPAKVSRKGKRSVAKLPVSDLETGARTDATLKGGFVLRKGKRAVRIKPLNLAVLKSGKVGIGGTIQKLGGKKSGAKPINVFNVAGKANVRQSGEKTTLKINQGKVSFTNVVVRTIRKHLRLKHLPKGQIATLNVNATRTIDKPVDPCADNPDAAGCPIVDPYLAQCDVAATSKVTGSLPGPAALPTLVGAEPITGPTSVNWGFKTSFRNYLVGPATGGSVHALNGATATGPAPAYTGIDFPIVDGQYSNNGTSDISDDKAIVNTSGTLVLCATKHKFRIVISDPTFVIDGANTRVIADVDTNLTGVWTPSQRVDLAKFTSPGEVIQEAAGTGSSIDFGSLEGVLTSTGADAICGTGEQAACNYTNETPVDNLNLKVEVASAMPTTDQYQAQCGVPVAKVASGTWSSVHNEPLPPLQSPISTVEPTTINWGFKSSFRSYVHLAPPAGTHQGLGGSTVIANPVPPNVPAGFSFPVSDGLYESGVAGDPSDDQAIINGTGTGLFCKSGHGFWTSITDPTIVIDGGDSRIEATISQNLNGGDGSGAWSTPERVDLARLDLDEISPIYNKSGSEVTWTNIPVTALQDFSTYAAGTALDPISVTVKTPYDTGAGDAAAWDALATYVQTNHPFPNSDAATGGCEVGVPAGGTPATPPAPDATSRTIDEHVSYGGTASAWMASPGVPAATPALTGTAVNGGGLDWGFRRALRSSLNSTGNFNVSGGASASDSNYYGNGGTLGQRGPGVFTPGSMGDPGDFFTWPTSTGTYNANGVGNDDDKLILRAEGVVAFCQTQTAQRYGIIFANPTVVIDGANSRITIDVMTRYRLSWVRATVDFATLDLSDATVAHDTDSSGGTTTRTWVFPDNDPDGAGPLTGVSTVKLTADGAKLAGLLSPGTYTAGANLDGATIRASFPE